MDKKESIFNFIKNTIIQNDDFILGDIVLNYALCLCELNFRIFKIHEGKFKKNIFNRIINRTLRLKYPETKLSELNDKIAQFIQFESRYLHEFVLRDANWGISVFIIESLFDYMFKKNLERLENIGEMDIEALGFLFNKVYISLENEEGGYGSESYRFEAGDHFYKLNTKDWSEDFNRVHNKSLKEVNCFQEEYRYARGSPIPQYRRQLICFWEFYDRLVELGFGYYTSWITTRSGRVFIHFRMFKGLYENRRDILPFIDVIQMSGEDIKAFINNCINERKYLGGLKKWDIDPNAVQELELDDIRMSRHITSDIKVLVWEICKGRCAVCGSKSELQYDHIIPFSKGGSNTVENIQLLCKTCNLKKSNKIE